jgi:hypothetical protein
MEETFRENLLFGRLPVVDGPMDAFLSDDDEHGVPTEFPCGHFP